MEHEGVGCYLLLAAFAFPLTRGVVLGGMKEWEEWGDGEG